MNHKFCASCGMRVYIDLYTQAYPPCCPYCDVRFVGVDNRPYKVDKPPVREATAPRIPFESLLNEQGKRFLEAMRIGWS